MGTWRECRPSHVNMNGPFPTFNPSVQLVQLDHRRNKEKSLGESQILRIYWRSTVLGLLCSNVNNIISTRGHKSQSQKPSPSLRFLKIEQILHLSSFLCLPPPVLLLREIYQIGANWGRGLSSPREQALSDFKIWGCHMKLYELGIVLVQEKSYWGKTLCAFLQILAMILFVFMQFLLILNFRQHKRYVFFYTALKIIIL